MNVLFTNEHIICELFCGKIRNDICESMSDANGDKFNELPAVSSVIVWAGRELNTGASLTGNKLTVNVLLLINLPSLTAAVMFVNPETFAEVEQLMYLLLSIMQDANDMFVWFSIVNCKF